MPPGRPHRWMATSRLAGNRIPLTCRLAATTCIPDAGSASMRRWLWTAPLLRDGGDGLIAHRATGPRRRRYPLGQRMVRPLVASTGAKELGDRTARHCDPDSSLAGAHRRSVASSSHCQRSPCRAASARGSPEGALTPSAHRSGRAVDRTGLADRAISLPPDRLPAWPHAALRRLRKWRSFASRRMSGASAMATRRARLPGGRRAAANPSASRYRDPPAPTSGRTPVSGALRRPPVRRSATAPAASDARRGISTFMT